MRTELKTIEEQTIPKFKGGTGAYHVRMLSDDKVKIMKGRLTKGSSIGGHIHKTNCEIIYILSGEGVADSDDGREILSAGDVFYCPQGKGHDLRNEKDEDLEFFAVVPELA
ncbi:MAG: cupin domain-containing protein [Eubacteriaceae bacterium]|jgi:quercetin dioxygenase-like cupin family protein|nr:cupin domain-containing protein [Eubacteriaceae bacterium]